MLERRVACRQSHAEDVREAEGGATFCHRPASCCADAVVGFAARLSWPGWSSLVMSCRTGMAHATADGMATGRVPAFARRSWDRRREPRRSAAGSAHGGSGATAVRAGGRKQGAAEREFPGAAAIGEEAEVADAVEPVRDGMQQEVPDEFIGGERHRL